MAEKEVHEIENRKLRKVSDMLCPYCHGYNIFSDHLGQFCENCHMKVRAHRVKKWSG